MATFVLEIGSEEVPSRFLPTEEQELETRFTAAPSDTFRYQRRNHVPDIHS